MNARNVCDIMPITDDINFSPGGGCRRHRWPSAANTVANGSLRSHLLPLMSPLYKATDTVGKSERWTVFSSSTYSSIKSLAGDLLQSPIYCRRSRIAVCETLISQTSEEDGGFFQVSPRHPTPEANVEMIYFG